MTNSQSTNGRTDEALLKHFVDHGSDAAFQELVEKHLGMVLGAAKRRVGNRALAEDVAQDVFAILARKAARLKAGPTLAGWLYRATMIECAEALRQERARGRKMKQISKQILFETEGENVWREALPLLDEAIATLPSSDRDVVVLRFFERKSFREIGAAIGKSEAAAQKQSQRALQKVSLALSRRGVTISAVLLATKLTTPMAEAAPAGLVQSISQSALSTASEIGAKTLILKSIETMCYAKTKTMLAVAAIIAVPLAMQWNANRHLSEELSRLREQPDARVVASPAARRERPVASAPPNQTTVTAPASAEAVRHIPDPLETTRQWELALFDPDPLRRGQRIHALLDGLTADTALVVAEAFKRAQESGVNFQSDFRLFLRAWGKLDGAAAMQAAAGPDEPVSGSAQVLAALAGWASANPPGALAWVDALPEGRNKENVVYGLLDGWSLTDFRSAAAYAESRPRSPARERFRKLLLERSLMAGGTPAAQQWFHGIPDDDHNRLYKQRAFDEVIQAMLYRDPSSAAHWISQLDGRPYLTGKAVRKTAEKMAASAPQATLEWLLSLEGLNDQQASSALGGTVGAWTKQDPGKAGAWLVQREQHPHYHAMADRFARGIAEVNPQLALQWARSIPDENLRSQSEMAVARTLVKTQGDASATMLAGAGFTADQIASAQSAAYHDTGLTFLVADSVDSQRKIELSQSLFSGEIQDNILLLKDLDNQKRLSAGEVMGLEWNYLLEREQKKGR